MRSTSVKTLKALTALSNNMRKMTTTQVGQADTREYKDSYQALGTLDYIIIMPPELKKFPKTQLLCASN